MQKKIACIGSGNMGTALMKGAAAALGPEQIFFADADKAKAKSAAKVLGAGVYSSNTDAAQKADYIFLAVKPQVLAAVLAEIAPALRERMGEKSGGKSGATAPALVSMAAGWSIERIRSILGSPLPLLRIMPNTPALISRGMIAMTVTPELSAAQAADLEKILSAAGVVDRVEEKYLDAVTGLSGSGPAFVYLFIEALADGGVQAGLSRDKALRYAAQTVLGSAAMVLETGKHPGELKDMVTSPAGTTIAGVAALENGGFRGIVMNAVDAAFRRAKELA